MRGIAFDLDDTLYPYEHFRISGFGAVARAAEADDGVPALRVFSLLCRARIESRGREFQSLAGELGLPADRIDRWLDVFRTHAPDIALPSGVAGTLTRLRSDGWRVGILTNGDPGTQRRKLAALGVSALVDAEVCAEDVARGGKPAAACFDAIAEALGTPASLTVYVGNDPFTDTRGARFAGLRTMRLRTPACPATLADDADLVIDRLDAVTVLAPGLVREEFSHVA
ncbi:MAG: HAD family hydrolase [Vicinamibacterales bacterium]